MFRTSTLLLIAHLILSSCSNERMDPMDPMAGSDPSFAPLLAANGLSPQGFTIDNTRDTVLHGTRGTIVTIPAGCFDGAAAPITLTLIEAPDISDLLLLHAPTISKGRVLVTDGVVHVNAFSNGRPVELKENASIEVEIPTSALDPDMEAFVGAYDAAGRLTWVEGNEMVKDLQEEVAEELTYQFLTIPLSLFPNRAQYFRMDSIARTYPWRNGVLRAPDEDLLIGKERAAFYTDAVRFLNDPAAEGTPLATREFAERLASLERYYYLWYYPEPEGARLHYDVFGPFQQRIFQIYLNNMDRELWYSDSLAVKVMDEWVPRNKKDSTELARYNEHRSRFSAYKEQRLTRPVTIDDHDVDLSTTDAYTRLLEKGVSKQEARRLIELNGLRGLAIADLEAQRTTVDTTMVLEDRRIRDEVASNTVRYYLLSVNKLGWINVDRYYEDPNARECEVIADVTVPPGVDGVHVSLVLHSTRSVIDGIRGKDGRYHFTQEDEYYRRLPMNEGATMVAMACKDGKAWLALHPIFIAEQVEEKLELASMGMDEFKAKLAELN